MSLGSLVVDLSANTTQFRSDLGKAAHLSNKFSNDMVKNAKIAATGFLALAGSVTATAAALTMEGINNADRINDLSKSAGISTESFSALTFAAKQSGVEIEGLATGLKFLNKNMVEAASGNKEMQAVFAAMGINIKNADGSLKSANQTLSEVAEKFSSYKDGAEKSALAIQVFGKSGADLIPLLNEGAGGIQSMTERAAELGLVISQETATAADAFNDKMGEMSGIASGLGTQLAATLLPSMTNLTTAFLEASKEGGALTGTAETLANFFKISASAAIGFGTSVAIAGKFLGAFAAEVKALLSGDMKEFYRIGNDFASDMDATAQKGSTLIKKLWEEPAQEIEKNAPATAKKLAAPIVKMAETVKKEREKMVKEIKMTYDDFADESLDAFQASQELSGMTKESYSEITEMSVEAAKSTQQAFADFLFDPFSEGLGGMVQSFGVAIQRMVANAAAAQLGKYLFGDFANGGSVGGVAGSLISGIGGMVGGGSIASGSNFDIGSPDFTLPTASASPSTMMQMTVNVSGVTNSGEMRQAAGAGARQALSFMQGVGRYA
jgi:hypothetical protein